MQETIVVVPCYNEVDRLDSDRFIEAGRAGLSLSFIFVDDGSTDGTRAILDRLAQREPRMSVLGLNANRGKAEAVRRGMQLAFERSPALVAYFDADLATPLAELDAMRAMFARDPELVLVLGSRVALLGRGIVRSPVRHYLGRVFATFASLALSLTVYDTQCGAKVFRNTPAVRSSFEEPFVTRWIFDVELLARLSVLADEGLLPPIERAAAEYPLKSWHDVSGSKLKAPAAFAAGWELARIWLRYRATSGRRKRLE